MPNCVRPPWIIRNVAAPLLVSLALHGLLFSALWFWPARTHSPPLTINSTRITLDGCVLDSPASTLLPAAEFPTDLLGKEVNITQAPRLEGPPPTPEHPTSRSQAELGSAREQSSATHPELASGREAELGNEEYAGGSLFPLPTMTASVVYVLDRSVSMGIDRKLDFARRELIASLRRLPPSVRFQVIDYNDSVETLIVDGQRGLLPAEPAIVQRAVSFLSALAAAGATNHFAALRRGLELRPDVLFFLTDAGDLKPEVISFITQRNQHSVIHTIELTRLLSPRPEGALAQLARDNHGTYRRICVRRLKAEE
jgi:VWA domain-containing protein